MGFTSLIEKIRDYWKHRGKRPNTYKIDKIYVLKNLVSPSAGGDNEDTLTTKAIKPLEFTGERFLPGEQGRIRLEHMHRYAVVQGLVQDKVILDIACGEGYGSALLAKSAQSVVGVDIAQEAIDHARELYRASNLKFVQGSATQLEFADASFDVVVSFETIEHLAEQEQMLKELSRVLRPDGILIMSSPNRPIYSEESGELNEFHVKELDFQEFDDLLGQQFKSIRYYGQRIQMGSIIHSITQVSTDLKAWTDTGQAISQTIPPVRDPIYFVAICSKNKDTVLPNIDTSAMYPDTIDLVKHYIGFAAWAKNSAHEIERLQGIIVDLQNQHTSFSKKVNHTSDIRHQKAVKLMKTIEVHDQESQRTKLELRSNDLKIKDLQAQLYERDQEIIALLNTRVQESNENKIVLLELKKVLLDSQQYIVQSQQSLEQLKIQFKNQSIGLLQKIKNKLRSQLRRNRLTVSAEFHGERSFSLDQKPWLVLFDANWYVNQYNDVKESGLNPLEHYWEFGMKEGRNPNAFFDALWYLDENLDVRTLGFNPLQHYWEFGGNEGRNPSARFNSGQYYLLNPDVKYARINPLEHYLLYGQDEGRKIHLVTDPLDEIKQENIKEIKKFLAPYASFFNTIQSDESYLKKVLSEIQFKQFEYPLVSIIIPIYGKWEYTLQCLYSLFINLPTQFGVEVIVVDDCSKDQSFSLLKKIQGIKLLRNDVNQGFIKSCNAGALVAQGEFVCFLNNDTVIFPMWLEELVETFHNLPNTGLVGSKLIYPDGRLQEAGGIIWKDGSAWNFGNKQSINLPEFNYAREVDYCSGASIILQRDLFREFGGFDEHYLPLYCEDSDIALKVRNKGLRVIYQPLSKLIHFEGATSGTNLSEGPKAYQVINSKKLFDRWKGLLAQYQENGQDVDRAKDRTSKYRVLVLDDQTPTPDKDAGSVTAFNMMILAREMGYQVTFIAADNLLYVDKYTSMLQKRGIEVLYAPYIQTIDDHLKAHGQRYDFALLFRPAVAEKNIEKIRTYCSRAKIIYHTIDLHYLRLLRQFELEKSFELEKQSLSMKAIEYSAIRKADASIVHSQEELRILVSDLSDSNLYVYPLVLSVPGTAIAFKDRSDIAFVGGYNHPPNIDAVEYFVNDVMPILRKKILGIKFLVIGSNAPPRLLKLAAKDVVIVGFVKDIRNALDKVRVSVAPLRYGAGIKGKVGASMAFGLPVVATKVAAEGMDLVDGVEILIADQPEEIASAIEAIYTNSQLWASLSTNGTKKARKLWGTDASLDIFQTILKDLDLPFDKPSREIKLY